MKIERKSLFLMQMENNDPNLINQLISPKKFDEFSTSTPQRRLAKLSVPMKFDAIASFYNWEHSLSFLRTTETAMYDSHVVPRPSIELTSAEEALLQRPTLNKSSTNKRSGKKMSNSRRCRMSFVGAYYKCLPVNKHQVNRRREKRIDAFSRCRKLIDEDRVRQSRKSVANNATFSIDGKTDSDSSLLNESYMARCEIVAFHDEIDRLQVNGSTSLNNIEDDLPVNENDENTNFEQLCNTKVSEHPYDETDLKMPSMNVLVHEENDSNARDSDEEFICKSENEENNNTLTLSTISSLNTTSTTTKANSHCTHTMYLHQHKIPQIVRHKSLARISLNTEVNASTCRQVLSAFNNLHPILKFYVVGITVAFVGILIHVFTIK